MICIRNHMNKHKKVFLFDDDLPKALEDDLDIWEYRGVVAVCLVLSGDLGQIDYFTDLMKEMLLACESSFKDENGVMDPFMRGTQHWKGAFRISWPSDPAW